MISKCDYVTYSNMEDMIESPKALPIKFIPKTKFWKNAVSNLNENINIKDRASTNITENINKKGLLYDQELNHLLSNYLNKMILATKQTLDDIRYSLFGNYSRLLDGDSHMYPKQSELKKALNTKVKALGQIFELTR